jgi:formylglycine-generating enzyme required for sulfatase activity
VVVACVEAAKSTSEPAAPQPVTATHLAAAVHDAKTFDHGCPPDMAIVDLRTERYCVDKWEASLVEELPSGGEVPHSPFELVNGKAVRAVSKPGVYPQGYISMYEAAYACAHAKKRLCTAMEWRKACVGPGPHVWGYGDKHEGRRCNDHGRNPVTAVFGPYVHENPKWEWDAMNSPKLNQLDGTLAKTGDHPGCTNGYGVFDMVGNLHEWVDDASGTFYGGYYQDARQHGEGCTYQTDAHAASYHDYSTGFRCCADVAR